MKKRLLICLGIFFQLSPLFAHPGTGIVRDRKGNLYYTDLSKVWKISPDGRRKVVLRNVHTHELFLDQEDYLYGEHLWYEGEATNKWGHFVWKLSPNGQVDTLFGPREGFLSDYSFVGDAKGNRYWASRGNPPKTVYRLGPDGRVHIHSREKLGQVHRMTSTADGVLYFLEGQDLKCLGKDRKIRLIARDIACRKRPEATVADEHQLMGIWTDKQGNVYVADYAGLAVRKITPGGKVSTVANSRLPWAPSGGLTLDDGALWLLETSMTNEVRVRLVNPMPLRSQVSGWMGFLGIIVFILLLISRKGRVYRF